MLKILKLCNTLKNDRNQQTTPFFLLETYILDILAQYNRSKPSPACTSSLGFGRLYILMLWLIVAQVIVLHFYT